MIICIVVFLSLFCENALYCTMVFYFFVLYCGILFTHSMTATSFLGGCTVSLTASGKWGLPHWKRIEKCSVAYLASTRCLNSRRQAHAVCAFHWCCQTCLGSVVNTSSLFVLLRRQWNNSNTRWPSQLLAELPQWWKTSFLWSFMSSQATEFGLSRIVCLIRPFCSCAVCAGLMWSQIRHISPCWPASMSSQPTARGAELIKKPPKIGWKSFEYNICGFSQRPLKVCAVL